MKCRTVNEYGYLMDNLSERRVLLRFVFWAASYLATGEVCPKEAVVLFRVLARSVVCSVWCDCFCDCY